MDRDLSAACQMFLVPATILFGALGVAGSEALKTLISLMGLVTSFVWSVRICIWRTLAPIDRNTALTLASTFVAAWLVALIAHAWRWAHGL